MDKTYTTKQLAEMYGLSDRQTRNWLKAIKDRRVELRKNRGIWPIGITIDFDEIRDLGLATYRQCADLCDDRDTTPETPDTTTAIATVTTDTTPDTPDTTPETTAIAPITPVTIVPCTGAGADQAIDALAILESRLSQAESQLAQRSQLLDDRARQRQQAIQNIARRAAQLEAQSIALDRREILEQILDSEAGKFANLAVG